MDDVLMSCDDLLGYVCMVNHMGLPKKGGYQKKNANLILKHASL